MNYDDNDEGHFIKDMARRVSRIAISQKEMAIYAKIEMESARWDARKSWRMLVLCIVSLSLVIGSAVSVIVRHGSTSITTSDFAILLIDIPVSLFVLFVQLPKVLGFVSADRARLRSARAVLAECTARADESGVSRSSE
jgi:hypothetical protein